MKARQFWGVVALLSLAVAGCSDPGPALELAEGTVTYNNAPVAGASVTFVFDDGQQSVGTTGPDGKCKLTTGSRPGAPIGEATVIVTKFSGGAAAGKSPDQMTPEDMKAMAEASMSSSQDTGPKNELPAKYATTQTSPLKADIQAGGVAKNTFTFDLKD